MNVFVHKALQSTKKDEYSDYSAYDNTNDARFESLRKYPKQIGLYKRHLDLEKEYEQKLKRYKKYLRLFILENANQKQKVEARFSKMTKQVINSRPYNIRYSYNWDSKVMQFSSAYTREAAHVCDENLKKIDSRDGLQEPGLQRTEDRLRPYKRGASRTGYISPERPLERLQSHRSVSVDIIPQVEENVYIRTEKLDGSVIYIKSDIKNIDPCITRSLTSLVDQKRKIKPIHDIK